VPPTVSREIQLAVGARQRCFIIFGVGLLRRAQTPADVLQRECGEVRRDLNRDGHLAQGLGNDAEELLHHLPLEIVSPTVSSSAAMFCRRIVKSSMLSPAVNLMFSNSRRRRCASIFWT
jgi:hypothetical protein